MIAKSLLTMALANEGVVVGATADDEELRSKDLTVLVHIAV